MSTEIINPENEQKWLELRTRDITSTDIAALFNLSPYCTAFELWRRKKEGKAVEFEPNEFAKWGLRLQDSIAFGVAEDNGWQIRRMTEYIRDPELRMGASFDFSICHHKTNGLTGETLEGDESQDGLLEIKNVFGLKFKDEWLEDDDGNIEAPPHIELQIQQQLAVSGRAFAYIAALVGGNKLTLIKRLPDQRIITAIKNKVLQFWASIDANVEPSPDFAKDAEFISSIYGYAEPGKVFDSRGDDNFAALAHRHKELVDSIKSMTEEKEGIKSQILMQITDAEKVLGDGFSISAGTVGPAEIAYHRDGYRLFRINWPRGKK